VLDLRRFTNPTRDDWRKLSRAFTGLGQLCMATAGYKAIVVMLGLATQLEFTRQCGEGLVLSGLAAIVAGAVVRVRHVAVPSKAS